jgi:hypothetical protein
LRLHALFWGELNLYLYLYLCRAKRKFACFEGSQTAVKVLSSLGRLETKNKALGNGEGEVVGVCCRGEVRRGEERS